MLCYVQGLTHDQAAARLGCPVGTVRSRLARGRDRLRDRLSHRGLGSAQALLTAPLAPSLAHPAVPATLVHSTAKIATLVAAGNAVTGATASASASAMALMNSVARSMFWDKLGMFAAVLVLGCATAAAGLVTASTSAGQRPAPAPAQAKPVAGEETAKEKASRGDWEDLNGNWDVVSVEDAGLRLEPKGPSAPPGLVGKAGPGEAGFDELHVIKDWFIFFLDGRLYAEWHVTKLDPDAEPKACDIQTARSLTGRDGAQGLFEHEAIYRVSRNRLMICVSKKWNSDEPTRPKAFSGDADSGQVLIVLKRRAADDKRESRRRLLEGSWAISSVAADGRPLADKDRGTRWNVTKTSIEWLDGDLIKMAFRYTSDRNSHLLELESDETGRLKGFWKAEERGVKATVCFGKEKDHPEELTAPAGSGRTLIVLKRLIDPPAETQKPKP